MLQSGHPAPDVDWVKKPTDPKQRRRRLLAHLVMVCLGVGSYVLIASVAEPHRSGALTRDGTGPDGVVWGEERWGDRQLVVELVGAEHHLRAFATPDGPRYDVLSAKTGEVIARNLHADDVYRVAPGLDLEQLGLPTEDPDGPEQLMLVLPDEH